MVSGLAFLGALAGSLAALLGVGDEPVKAPDADLLEEIRALRRQIDALSRGPSAHP